jgi:putative sterol carrier protein
MEKMNEQSIREWIVRSHEHVIPEKTSGVNAKVQLCLTGEEAGSWHISIHDQEVEFCEGMTPKPNVTITADSGIMLKILTGGLNGSQAFLQGKLKVHGDIPLSIRLLTMFHA